MPAAPRSGEAPGALSAGAPDRGIPGADGVDAFGGVELVGVGFSPGGSAEKWVLSVINGAKKELRVSAYTFTSRPVAAALLRARQRGVDVAVLLHAPAPRETPFIIPFLRGNGIPFRLGNCKGLMHNKFIVADGAVVQTGSYNYTRAAASVNAENVVVLRGAACARVYLREWARLWREAQATAGTPKRRGVFP
ncbi:MAG: phospholipase D family protein [Puniceicoccales bacterium]|nr:phospholipase D family protein [Puniceicoccales bacterium]